MSEPIDLHKLAEDIAQLRGLLPGEVSKLRMFLETVDEAAYRRGYAAATSDMEGLRVLVLYLQRELSEVSRKKSDV